MQEVVVLIEDEADMRKIIAEVCLDRGLMVLPFKDYESYLTAKYDGTIDVFIADIFVKGIGGIEGISRIKEKDTNARVLAISGGFADMSGEDALRAARKVGADHALGKPFTVAALNSALDHLLSGAG